MTLSIRNTGAIFGAFFALAICAMLYLVLTEFGVDWRLVIGLVLLGLLLLGYIVATVTVKSANGTEDATTSFFRGLLIGINSAANFGLIWVIFNGVFGVTATLVIGGVIGGINLLAGIGPISQWEPYQAILGWANWLMPMSWLIVALGLLFMLFSLLLHVLITLPFGVTFTRVGIKSGPLAGKVIDVDWPTGTIFMFGGIVANLNYLKTAFNMGNFSFVHYQASSTHMLHEAGHTLNLAAFGSVFHLVGALDENLPLVGGGHLALAELLAEGNDPSGGARLLMWS